MISDPLFQAVQAQNNKSHFSQCDGKQDLSAMFPTAAIVKVIIYDYLCRQSYNNIVAIRSAKLLTWLKNIFSASRLGFLKIDENSYNTQRIF